VLAGRKPAAGFASNRRTMSRVIRLVDRDDVVVIVVMRIFIILSPGIGVVIGMLRSLVHGPP
jgi:hypothetical protein